MLIDMITGVPGVSFRAGSCRTPQRIASSQPRRQSSRATEAARNMKAAKLMAMNMACGVRKAARSSNNSRSRERRGHPVVAVYLSNLAPFRRNLLASSIPRSSPIIFPGTVQAGPLSIVERGLRAIQFGQQGPPVAEAIGSEGQFHVLLK